MRLSSTVRTLLIDRVLGCIDYYCRRGLRAGWGGPFNGQAFRQRLYYDLSQALRFKAIVETGTYLGTTTALFEEAHIPVYTVESSSRYYTYSWLRFRRSRFVVVHHGDSREYLSALAQQTAIPNSPVLFYLDSHWERDLPLREELAIIFSTWRKAVVMMDDFEVPGSGYGFDDYGNGNALTYEYIAPVVATFHLAIYYPACPAERETGRKRGCAVLCRESEVCAALDRMDTLRKRHPSSLP